MVTAVKEKEKQEVIKECRPSAGMKLSDSDAAMYDIIKTKFDKKVAKGSGKPLDVMEIRWIILKFEEVSCASYGKV
jgi:hypothetical protein